MAFDLYSLSPKKKTSVKTVNLGNNVCMICGKARKQVGRLERAHVLAKSKGGRVMGGPLFLRTFFDSEGSYFLFHHPHNRKGILKVSCSRVMSAAASHCNLEILPGVRLYFLHSSDIEMLVLSDSSTILILSSGVHLLLYGILDGSPSSSSSNSHTQKACSSFRCFYSRGVRTSCLLHTTQL